MRRLLILLLACLLVFSGCAATGMTVQEGETLSREEQKSLYDQRVEQQPEPEISGKGEVYWTPSGSKYHKDPACSYLSNSKQILSGTLAQAANHGADSPCSRCAGG